MTSSLAPGATIARRPAAAGQSAVRGPVAESPLTVEADAEARFGPIVVTSILLTSLVFFFGVGLPMWWFTGGIWDGVGLGAFTAFWGGPGFGLMTAAAIWSSRSAHA